MDSQQRAFKCYEDFFRSITPKWRHDLYRLIQDYRRNDQIAQTLDICSDGSILVSSKIDEIFHFGGGIDYTQLEKDHEALNSISKDVSTRLVLFTQAGIGPVHDLYGVEFQIEPSFFYACRQNTGTGFDSSKILPSEAPFFLEADMPTFLNLGQAWCAKLIDQPADHPLIKRGLNIGKTITICAVIVLYLLHLVLLHIPLYHSDGAVLIASLPREIAMDPKNSEPPGNNTYHYMRRGERPSALWSEKLLNLPKIYSLMLSDWSEAQLASANDQPLEYIIPLLELYVNRFQAVITRHYGKFLDLRNDPTDSGFRSEWRPLRDALVNAAMPFEAVRQYKPLNTPGTVYDHPNVQRLLKRFDHLHKTASQFEQHMRDDLQLQVGYLSLLESKESIRQSKIALEESKRVKMRTLVASISSRGNTSLMSF
jgi:hypothetical protein